MQEGNKLSTVIYRCKWAKISLFAFWCMAYNSCFQYYHWSGSNPRYLARRADDHWRRNRCDRICKYSWRPSFSFVYIQKYESILLEERRSNALERSPWRSLHTLGCWRAILLREWILSKESKEESNLSCYLSSLFDLEAAKASLRLAHQNLTIPCFPETAYLLIQGGKNLNTYMKQNHLTHLPNNILNDNPVMNNPSVSSVLLWWQTRAIFKSLLLLGEKWRR